MYKFHLSDPKFHYFRLELIHHIGYCKCRYYRNAPICHVSTWSPALAAHWISCKNKTEPALLNVDMKPDAIKKNFLRVLTSCFVMLSHMTSWAYCKYNNELVLNWLSAGWEEEQTADHLSTSKTLFWAEKSCLTAPLYCLCEQNLITYLINIWWCSSSPYE